MYHSENHWEPAKAVIGLPKCILVRRMCVQAQHAMGEAMAIMSLADGAETLH